MSKMWSIHTLGYYRATERNGVLTYITTSCSLKTLFYMKEASMKEDILYESM